MHDAAGSQSFLEVEGDDSYILGFPGCETFQRRSLVTAIFAPTIFLASFAWEGFGDIAEFVLGYSSESAVYCLMTGLGMYLGLVISDIIVLEIAVGMFSNDEDKEKESAYFRIKEIAAFCAGTMWQFSVNIYYDFNSNFNGAFFFVFLLCGGTFYVAVLLLREINNLLPKELRLKVSRNNRETVWYDFLLSLSVGSADAFFVCTDDSQLNDGWCPGFNVSSSTSIIVGLVLAGSSSLCGFLVMQTLQNLLLSEGYGWPDLYYQQNVLVRDTSTHLHRSTSQIYRSTSQTLFSLVGAEGSIENNSKQRLQKKTSSVILRPDGMGDEEDAQSVPGLYRNDSFIEREHDEERPLMD